MKIDLHVHTKERSACGRASEIQQVRAAIRAGLDAIVFTDHSQLAPPGRVAQLNEAFAPFRIYGGVEIGIDGEDLIVLGINDGRLTADKWSYPQLRAFTRENGGFLALVHPFRYSSDIMVDIERHPPDAIEVYSPHILPEAVEQILDLASALGIPTLSNSDAHSTGPIGKYYNILHRTPDSERELVGILRKGMLSAIVRETGDTPHA